MFHGNRKAMLLAASGAALLSLELIAALVAAPHLRETLATAQGRAVLKAGEVVWGGVTAGAASTFRQLAGDALLYSVREASRISGALLRLAPEGLTVRQSWAIEATPAPAAAPAVTVIRAVECRVIGASCTTPSGCAPSTTNLVPAVKAAASRSSVLWSRVLVAS
jgi:hypothetical protein